MRSSLVIVVLLLASSLVLAGDLPPSFAQAKEIWEGSKDRKEYQTYLAQFTQYNNYLHLDEKDGCYGLGKGPVELMLVITHDGASQYATIEQVLSSVDNAKAACFKRSYGGVRTKIPPFLPFVLRLQMG